MSGLLLSKNRSALYDNELVEKYVAGIVLKGYEVKAIREKKAAFDGVYVQIVRGEVFVVNMHIGEYSKQGRQGSPEGTRRSRKLLLNKKEIAELTRHLDQKGRTAVPLALVLENNRIKLEFAVVKGKKEYEKKVTQKERQIKKDLGKETKEVRRSLEK